MEEPLGASNDTFAKEITFIENVDGTENAMAAKLTGDLPDKALSDSVESESALELYLIAFS